MTGSVSPDGAREPQERSRRAADDDYAVLDLRRPFTSTIPDSSVGAVRAVARLDGRTKIIAARAPGGSWWKPRHRMRFTRPQASELRNAGVSEVILKRGMKRASFPLAWLSNRQG